MFKLLKFIFYILVIAALLVEGYRYFHLDQNVSFQAAIHAKDPKAAQAVIKDVVENQVKAQATQYVYDHNSYFVSKSNNICTSLQTKFDVLKAITTNPVECFAEAHTFTARIKISGDSYYCADTSGFYTTTSSDLGYSAGVKCK